MSNPSQKCRADASKHVYFAAHVTMDNRAPTGQLRHQIVEDGN